MGLTDENIILCNCISGNNREKDKHVNVSHQFMAPFGGLSYLFFVAHPVDN